jgi:SulP family sulfate permease
MEYLVAATLMAGAIQIVFGVLRLEVLMRFVSRSVRTGFVNALAILIFSAQVPQMLHVGWQTYAMIALGLAIIYLVPRVTTLVPSPLICIVVLTALSAAWPMPLRTVSDLGPLPSGLPALVWPHVPLTLQTLEIVAPYALAMAMVGLLESLMTATVVDDLTDTHSDKRRECTGLGVANVAVGLFGGIAGCGMIGQTVGNLRYGGSGRLSTFTAGAFLLLLMVALHPFVARVPVAALVAIMIMVSVSTFSWSSLRALRHHPGLSSVVMLATVAVVVATHDLAVGVGVGVLLSGVFFAAKAARMVHVTAQDEPARELRTYRVAGQVFFASSDLFTEAFDYRDPTKNVRIDLTAAHFWDITAVAALERVVERLVARGHRVEVAGGDPVRHAIIADQSGAITLSD